MLMLKGIFLITFLSNVEIISNFVYDQRFENYIPTFDYNNQYLTKV